MKVAKLANVLFYPVCLLVVLIAWKLTNPGVSVAQNDLTFATVKVGKTIGKDEIIKGIVAPSEFLNVNSQVSFIVDDILVKPNDLVAVGDKVLAINIQDLERRMLDIENQLTIMKLEAKKNVGKLDVLIQKKQHELEVLEQEVIREQAVLNTVQSENKVARERSLDALGFSKQAIAHELSALDVQVKSLKKQLALDQKDLQDQLTKLTAYQLDPFIRSPIKAVVLHFSVSVGKKVENDAAVFKLGSFENTVILADDAAVGRMSVELDGKKVKLKGKTNFKHPNGDAGVALIPKRRALGLPPGDKVDILVSASSGSKSLIVQSEDPIFSAEYLFVKRGNKLVKVGVGIGEYHEQIAPLYGPIEVEEGDIVVVSNMEYFKDYDEVKLIQ